MSTKSRRKTTVTGKELIESWSQMEPAVSLEGFFLSKLELTYIGDINAQPPSQMRSKFGYEVRTHKEDDSRFMVRFRVETAEIDEKEEPVGRSVVAEAVGQFGFTRKISKNEKGLQMRIHGSAFLYGMLRGIISSASAHFPNGPLMLPLITPQRLVAMVEDERGKIAEAKEKAKASPKEE